MEKHEGKRRENLPEQFALLPGMVEEHCVVSWAMLHTVTPSPLQGIQALKLQHLKLCCLGSGAVMPQAGIQASHAKAHAEFPSK